MTELSWDPFDEGLDSEPHGVWRRMRDEAPVYRNERYDFWALSRFDDVAGASREPATFSSARGTVPEMMGSDMSATGQIIFMDPPEHTHLRAHVSRAFTPRQMAKMEQHVRSLCGELLDPLVGAGSFDYIPADSKVLLLTGSAGRDEREYPDADRFDVRREMKQHASFGHGIHFCVGAALARLEGRVTLEETLLRFPEWDVDPEGVVRQHTSTVRGYSSVEVRP